MSEAAHCARKSREKPADRLMKIPRIRMMTREERQNYWLQMTKHGRGAFVLKSVFFIGAGTFIVNFAFRMFEGSMSVPGALMDALLTAVLVGGSSGLTLWYLVHRILDRERFQRFWF